MTLAIEWNQRPDIVLYLPFLLFLHFLLQLSFPSIEMGWVILESREIPKLARSRLRSSFLGQLSS